MVFKTLIVTIFAWSAAAGAHSAVEIDEYGSARTAYKTADSGAEMRASRRAGLGITAGGLSGIFGVNLEICFTETFGLNGGFGMSGEFQSLFLAAKHVFGGRWLMPYGTYGYARWFNNAKGGHVGKTTPGFVADKFLSESERESGIFSENLIFGGLGGQYLQLKGEWAGASVYLEALAVFDTDDLVLEPTLGTGFVYYF